MAVKAGSIRFNTDSHKLEIYNGEAWWEMDSTSPEAETGGTRGIIAGGGGNGGNFIGYINVDIPGNEVDFGDLSATGYEGGATASRTRWVCNMGYVAPADTNTMEYVTIATTSNSTDFGDLLNAKRCTGAFGNSNRGIWAGGYPGQNTMDYITIASTGNAKDFGDITFTGNYIAAGVNSPVRGLVAGANPGGFLNRIDYVTTATLGNGADFGDLQGAKRMMGGNSNAVRGLWSGGRLDPSPDLTDQMYFVNIASQGNAKDFGNLLNEQDFSAGCSSSTRAVICGGYMLPAPSVAHINTLQFVQIMHTGNAVDFGDLTASSGAGRGSLMCSSNGHGGLG